MAGLASRDVDGATDVDDRRNTEDLRIGSPRVACNRIAA